MRHGAASWRASDLPNTVWNFRSLFTVTCQAILHLVLSTVKFQPTGNPSSRTPAVSLLDMLETKVTTHSWNIASALKRSRMHRVVIDGSVNCEETAEQLFAQLRHRKKPARPRIVLDLRTWRAKYYVMLVSERCAYWRIKEKCHR